MVEAEVPARQTGVLARFQVQEGDAVAEDAVLAALDDRLAALKLKQAEVERDAAAAKVKNDVRIQYADKALEVARAELKRSQDSNAQFPNSISESQLDVEQLTVEKLELERRQAEHDLRLDQFDLNLKENAVDAARLELDLHSVRAPFPGVVALVRGRRGEWVQPGAAVLRLVAIDTLRAEGFAPAEALPLLTPGLQVRFIPESNFGEPASAGGGAAADAPSQSAPHAGKLRFVSPEIDPVTRQVRIWAEIENPSHRLRPGQQGRLEMTNARMTNDE
jgi:macrolide-specific efflux system membrane fusion protein